MTIPPWLIQLGSLAGLFTLAYTLADRLLTGRPGAYIQKLEHGRGVRCINNSAQDILIKKISTWPNWVHAALHQTLLGIIGAAAKQTFSAIIKPGADREFFIVFSRGELLDEATTLEDPFVVMMFWRKARAMWMPQFPVLIFSSAKSMRRLDRAKS